MRQPRTPDAIKRLVEGCCRRSPNGLVPHGPKGTVPSQSQRLACDVAQDGVSPPRSVRRMDRSDGARVPSHDRAPRTERVEPATVAVDTCIGRMVRHAGPKGFQRSRDDGGPAPTTVAKGKGGRPAARAKGEGVGKGAVQILARLTSRQRHEQSPGRAPWRCPPCRQERGVGCRGPPTSGGISDEGEGIQRGTSASTAPRAGP